MNLLCGSICGNVFRDNPSTSGALGGFAGAACISHVWVPESILARNSEGGQARAKAAPLQALRANHHNKQNANCESYRAPFEHGDEHDMKRRTPNAKRQTLNGQL
jgi:hypothetical protein